MLKVIKSGFYTTIQDTGRKGFASYGVPVSGVMDLYSASLANYVLGNSLNAAVLEITYGNCSFLFEEDTLICVAGADFNASINTKRIALNRRVIVHKGDVFSLSTKNYGVRTYVAVLGGFQSEIAFSSRSFYKNITSNYLLKKGDCVPYEALEFQENKLLSSVKINKSHCKEKQLRCFEGPEFYLLNEKQKEELQDAKFSISNDHSRMGYRLNELLKNDLKSMLTSAVLPGTVQLTSSGKLIVLMRDCQVTGGYPRILQLQEEAISRLSQKTTNDIIRFNIEK